MFQLQYNCSDDEVLIYRMIPPSSKAFLLTNLVSGTQYDLCVLAAWEDSATTLTATSVVGCVQFHTGDEYPQCQSLRSHFLGGTMILVVGGVIVATLLVFIVILMVRYKTAAQTQAQRHPAERGGGVSLRLAPEQPVLLLILPHPRGRADTRDNYTPRGQEGALSSKWRTGAPKACPNLDHLLGAFTSLELRGPSRDPGPSGATAATASAPPTDKEPLLGRAMDSTLSRLLMLPLDCKPKRSHSFDMGEVTATAATDQPSQFYSYPRRISRIWTKRSLSVNGMLLQYDEEGEGGKGAPDVPEWVMESTV
ncbi:hypothetical protein GJAV_G00107620 [Gymnothorax javanicus]|nr:hypothetical protein GJAV_G00107620 [Gymnothorax javanicus]